MSVLQNTVWVLLLLLLLVSLFSAIFAALEAHELGMGEWPDANGNDSLSPTVWFCLVGGLWIVGYPLYIIARCGYGRSNLLKPAIGAMAAFLLSLVVLGGYRVHQRSTTPPASDLEWMNRQPTPDLQRVENPPSR